MQLNFGITCKMCGNKNNNDFYLMPLREKVGLNDFVNSQSKYEIKCKQCGKAYLFQFKISELDLTRVNMRQEDGR